MNFIIIQLIGILIIVTVSFLVITRDSRKYRIKKNEKEEYYIEKRYFLIWISIKQFYGGELIFSTLDKAEEYIQVLKKEKREKQKDTFVKYL